LETGLLGPQAEGISDAVVLTLLFDSVSYLFLAYWFVFLSDSLRSTFYFYFCLSYTLFIDDFLFLPYFLLPISITSSS
jgi:hypothetical protein